MEIDGLCDDKIALTDDEAKLLSEIIKLFESKGEYAGADFRLAFVSAALGRYCAACGNGGDRPCYCTRDD